MEMSKNTDKSDTLNKSSNISINKIQTQKLFVFPSDIVSMIIDKFTNYFNK